MLIVSIQNTRNIFFINAPYIRNTGWIWEQYKGLVFYNVLRETTQFVCIIKHISTISSLFILRNDWRGHESKQGVNIAKLDIEKGVYLLGAIFQLLL